jgi:hypothetical protein
MEAVVEATAEAVDLSLVEATTIHKPSTKQKGLSETWVTMYSTMAKGVLPTR